MLDEPAAVAQATDLLKYRKAELRTLDKVHAYLRGRQPLPVVPRGAPAELRRLAKMSRVNMVKVAVGVPAQALHVAGYRTGDGGENLPAWEAWQANRMDARQTGIYRAAIAYGTAYARVTPGDTHPVIKGVSPRNMTAMYGEDEAWPTLALEKLRGGTNLWRLYDDEGIYTLRSKDETFEFVKAEEHPFKVTPVVRFRSLDDLDDDQVGEVDDLMPIQDQIDFTTFGLLVAQHFQAFKQRYVIGWTTADENEKAKASASALWTFEDSPNDIKVGEFTQSSLDGYLSSRSGSVENLATLAQLPPQHILGKLVNISADALTASESIQGRKVTALETSYGEADEQIFWLIDVAENRTPDISAQVRWEDTEARSFAATVDGLGKLASMLGVPKEALWERVPGTTEQDLALWKRLAKEQGGIELLVSELARSTTPPPG